MKKENEIIGGKELFFEYPGEFYPKATIMRDEEKSEIWYRLQMVLSELNRYANMLLGAESIAFMHYGYIPGTTSLKLPFGKLTAFEAKGNGATLGLLKKDKYRFLIIVSHNPYDRQIIKPTIQAPTLLEITQPNYVDINNRPGEILLEPGGYMIYRWEE